ncbi:putative D-aminoacylase [Cercophora newfieldiana]|uniref:D-aminoacylase n=1 Tax=Cercophora newfieldiana TaxID=92897 RepID=A0AA39YAW9_9PEZI|nr:putative D-aminoacylase [Cercophora newfieldiana]
MDAYNFDPSLIDVDIDLLTTPADKIKALGPTIQEICNICGVAGVSIGVVQRGSVIYSESFGFRDVENRIKGNADTVYYLGSLTKGFTAEAIGILVEEGKLEWTTPVTNVVPEFFPKDLTIHNQASMVDLLSHRTGLERADALWAQSNNNILLNREQGLRTINQLRAVTPFRGEYRYNNWGYEIAGRVIENLTGGSYSDFLNNKIFKPLGMSRTFNNDSECHGADNVAKGYMTYDDGTPCPVPRPYMAEGTLMNPAGGIQSSVNDLLKYYATLAKSWNDQQTTGMTNTPGSPLKQLVPLLSGNIRTVPSLREQSYAMGWARAQLPGRLCDTSRNQPLMPQMPVIGQGLVLYHHGMLVGFTSAVYIFPESLTVVLLLSNSVAINDGPDWIGHLIIQTLCNDPFRHDYVALARRTLSPGLSAYDRIEGEFKAELQNKIPTAQKPLTSYEGDFYNETRTFFIHIWIKNCNELWMNFQGNQMENYRLKHHNGDEFSWHMTWNEQVKRGRNPVTYMEYWKIKFTKFFQYGAENNRKAKVLSWALEKDLPGEGVQFARRKMGKGFDSLTN